MTQLRLRLLRALVSASLASLLASACIYDPDDRCGPHQHLGPNSSCVCDDGLVLQGQGCVPCGDNETWQSGLCVCSDGYTRSADDGGTCVLGGPGSSCDLKATPSTCQGADFTVCRDHGEGDGYCTTTCSADEDCPHGFVCDLTVTPSTCKTAAVGEGDACKTQADCAGKDATYCETVYVHKCLVPGCSPDNPVSCSEGWLCCDTRPLGLNLTLCAPVGLCPTAAK